MAPLTVTSTYTPNETSVSNIFLDTYMPSANGEFVKVYLCLLRMFTDPSHKAATLSDIADTLNHTEGDIIRALKYWESAGLLDIGYEENYPATITLLPLGNGSAGVSRKAPAVSPVSAAVPSSPLASSERSKPHYSKKELEQLCEDENIHQIIYVSEQLLGKTLTTTETNTLLYIYNDLHFSEDLLEYLMEYCVSNEKRSMRYIEAVAIAWHEEGVSTVEDAKHFHEIHSKNVFSIMKVFGIDDRKPGKPELDYISKWYDEYGFEREVILEACSRTIQSIHKPSFEYADTILSNWRKMNVHTMSDIDSADAARPKKVYPVNGIPAGNYIQNKGNASTKPVNNRFNNFTQRTYNFTDLEKKLIGKKGDKE